MKLMVAGLVTVLQLVAFATQGADEEVRFAQAIAAYVELHHQAVAGLPPSAAGPESGAASTLAQQIDARRPKARPGDILGSIGPRIREVVRAELASPRGAVIRSAIDESNVHGVRIRVNHRYPPGVPRTTMPGQLLARLPPLPPELQYRILGNSLLLIDEHAQTVVDVLPDVLPANKP